MRHYPRFQSLVWGVVLSLLLLLPGKVPAQSETAPPARFYQSEVELLRVAEQRLYLWLPAGAPANSDFTIELLSHNDLLLRCGVDKVAERVVVSEPLDDSLSNLVESAAFVQATIFLAAASLPAGPLVIGLPSATLQMAAGHGELGGAPLQNEATYSSYEDLAAAQVELALGRLDLLLLPANEVDQDLRCKYRVYPTTSRVEWYLATDLPDYDLLPAALSYCLKGALADTSLQLSSVISANDAARYFPASTGDAAALFEQMPATQAQRSIGCGTGVVYPATLSFLRRRLNNCGGSVTIVPDDADLPLRVMPVVTHGDSLLAADQTLGQLYQQLDAAGFGWASRLHDEQGSLAALSSQLSRELKLIPLGSQPLVLLARPEVHHVAGSFYLVEQQ